MSIKVKNQTLPGWIGVLLTSSSKMKRDAMIYYLSTLGWTYPAISDASGLTRERTRQICLFLEGLSGHTVPEVFPIFPSPPAHIPKPKKIYVEPSPKTLAKLLALQPAAQKVRSSGKSFRREAEQYTALLNYAHKIEKVPLYRLAKRLGVTHGALRFRLVRYGYLTPRSGKSKVYKPVSLENRFDLGV
jgi:hypothetical protein